MKSRTKKITAIAVCICVLLGFVIQGGGIRALATALNQAIRGSEIENTSNYYKTNIKARLGSEENPFIILEIVPTEDQALWGYYIPDCEPVDMKKAQMLYSRYNLKLPLVDKNPIFSADDTEEFGFYDQIPEGDFVLDGPSQDLANKGNWITLKDIYPDCGNRGFDLEHSASDQNFGQWQIKTNKDKSGNPYHTEQGIYKEAGDGQRGYFTLNDDGEYVYDPNGTYIWVPKNKISSEDSSQTIVTRADEYVFHRRYLKMTNNDQIIQKMYNANSSSFTTKVVTVTPAQLQSTMDSDGKFPLIEEADLISIHNLQEYADLIKIYHRMHGMDESDAKATFFNAAEGDLTYDVTMALVNRMATDRPASMVIQKPLVWNCEPKEGIKTEQSNFHKLLIMLLQYQPKKFLQIFGNYLTKENINGYDKVVYRPDYASGSITEFTNTTFASSPTNQNQKMYSEMRYLNINSGGTDLVDHIMTTQGDPIVSELLNDSKNIGYTTFDPNNPNGDWSNNTTSEGFDYFGKKPGDKLSLLEGLEFILQPQQYTPKLRILEVQPCDKFIYKEDENWKEYYQGLFPWYKPTTDEDSWLEDKNLLEVTTMPTWEFNGSVGRYDYNAKDADENRLLLTTESSDDLLARYDIIIFGSKQDSSNGKYGYNEFKNGHAGTKVNLGHLIYTSIGGTTYNGNVGVINGQADEAMDLRYSGNDITLKKMLEVEDFLRAGKPVVVDNNLYTSNGSVDTSKVDKNSKLYDLLTWEDKGKMESEDEDGKIVKTDRNAHENRFVYGNINNGKMKKLINGNLCRLMFCDDEDAYPVEYDYTYENKNGAQGVIKNEIYQGKNADGQAVLVYHFYVAGTSMQGYRAYLHVDVDGDGVYSGSLKQISEVDNMNAAMGEEKYIYDTSEEPLALKFYSTKSDMRRGNALGTSDNYILQPYTQYYAVANIPKERQGIIPWKLEIQEMQNEYLRSSAVDYTAVLNNEKDTINVLQMNLQGKMTNNGPIANDLWGTSRDYSSFTKESIVVKNNESYEQFNARRIQNGGIPETDDKLWKQLNNAQRITPEKFRTYLEPVQEFDVNIQYLFNTDWYKLFGTPNKGESGYDKTASEVALENWKDFLSHYDMVVFGFVDQNSFTNNAVYAEGIKDFVEQGKGLILSHDTVTDSHMQEYTNQSAAIRETYGAYNSWLRSTAGQRRAYYNKKADGTYEKSYSHVMANGSDVSFVSNANLGNNSLKKYFTKITEEIDGGSIEPEFYGTWQNEFMTNDVFLYVRTNCRHPYEAGRAPGTNGSYVKDREKKGGSYWNQGWQNYLIYDTTMVKLTNNGQITTYPYKLNPVIEVLQTHVQNFQLDLDYLQGGDVNVWFTLSDSYDNEVQAAYGGSRNNVPNTTEKDNNIYSAKDQDARNQFYIYNKGNITYTGSGHGIDRGRGQTNSVMTDDEVKLFVNTMIAAYRAPDSKPYVEVDNADTVSSDDENLIYVDFDGSNEDAAVDGRLETVNGEEMVRVEISMHDIKSAMASNIKSKQYYLDVKSADEAGTPSSYPLYDKNGKDGQLLTRNNSGKAEGWYNVDAKDEEGIPYVFYVPYKEVRDNNSVSVVFETYATYVKGGKSIKTSVQKTKATVMILPLFDLS